LGSGGLGAGSGGLAAGGLGAAGFAASGFGASGFGGATGFGASAGFGAADLASPGLTSAGPPDDGFGLSFPLPDASGDGSVTRSTGISCCVAGLSGGARSTQISADRTARCRARLPARKVGKRAGSRVKPSAAGISSAGPLPEPNFSPCCPNEISTGSDMARQRLAKPQLSDHMSQLSLAQELSWTKSLSAPRLAHEADDVLDRGDDRRRNRPRPRRAIGKNAIDERLILGETRHFSADRGELGDKQID
jgi:hypothetical protein